MSAPDLEFACRAGTKGSTADTRRALFVSGPFGDVARQIEHALWRLAVRVSARPVGKDAFVSARPVDESKSGATANQAVRSPGKATAFGATRRVDPLGRCGESTGLESAKLFRICGADAGHRTTRFDERRVTERLAEASAHAFLELVVSHFAAVQRKRSHCDDVSFHHVDRIPVGGAESDCPGLEGNLVRGEHAPDERFLHQGEGGGTLLG